MVTLPGAGSPGEGALAKRRRTKGRGRDFYVTIEFAAKIRMRAIDDMMRGQADAHADRAQDALRVLDIVLRESASERCSSSLNVYVCVFVLFVLVVSVSLLINFCKTIKTIVRCPFTCKAFTGCRGYLLIRDNFFHPNLGPVGNLGEGVEAWRGYHSSIRPTGLGLTLNLGKWHYHVARTLPTLARFVRPCTPKDILELKHDCEIKVWRFHRSHP